MLIAPVILTPRRHKKVDCTQFWTMTTNSVAVSRKSRPEDPNASPYGDPYVSGSRGASPLWAFVPVRNG